MWFLMNTNPLDDQCATDDCLNPPSWRLEVKGTGSDYCHNCKSKIETLTIKTFHENEKQT